MKSNNVILDKLDYIYEAVIKKAGNRKVVIYGYSDRNKDIADKLSERGIRVSFFVDRALSRQTMKDVFCPEILDGHSEEYFVIIPLLNHQDMVNLLVEYGFSEKDYTYLGNIDYKILREENDYFEDNHGNRIIGRVDHTKIFFCGFNSTVIIPKDCALGKNFILYIGDDSVLEIGSKTRIDCKLTIYDNSVFKCGERCVFENGLIQLFDAKTVIGDSFTIENGHTMRILRKSSLEIGNDCMFSYNISIRTNDGHAIFDVNTGENINSTDEICAKRNIKIGNHVWIGTNSIIMYNTDIADGSIIGAMSFVKSKLPNNCAAAGVPARVIKRDVAWSRNNIAADIEECGMEYINCTRED